MSTTTQPPKHKRRWCQFSLRTLLLVMLVACFGFAWIGWRMRQARVNRARVAAVEDAVKAIEKLGGEVKSAYKKLRPQTWLENQFDDPGDADDPVGVLKVTEVVLTVPIVTDTDLECLKELPHLEALYLSETNVTDAGLEHLKGLAKLRILSLSDTGISGTGLKHVSELTSLRVLYLNNTNITDTGLMHLQDFKNLTKLQVSSDQITYAGLKKLERKLSNCNILSIPPPLPFASSFVDKAAWGVPRAAELKYRDNASQESHLPTFGPFPLDD